MKRFALSVYARHYVVQAGWPVDIRIVARECEYLPDAPNEFHLVSDDAAGELSAELEFFKRHADAPRGMEIVPDAVHKKMVPLTFSVKTTGWADGVHHLKCSAQFKKQTLSARLSISVLSKKAFWRQFAANWESSLNHPDRSLDIGLAKEAFGDVLSDWHHSALEDLGISCDWEWAKSLLDQKRKLLPQPVNMWTLYQLFRVLQRLSYEQLFWGGVARIDVLEESDSRLTVCADLRTNCKIELASHFLEMLKQSVMKMPDLESVKMTLAPPDRVSIHVRFPVFEETTGGEPRGPEITVVGPGDYGFTPLIGEFNLESLRVCH